MSQRFLLLPLLILSLCGGLRAAPRPNFLLIVADDLGYADVGFNGATDIATPHIDSLARHGVVATNGYVSAPQCAPSRCGFLTGRYQQRFGYEFNNDRPGAGLPLAETTLADRLAALGYRTGLVGKWHLGADDAHHPLARGFGEFFGFRASGHHVYIHDAVSAANEKQSPDLWRNREAVPHTAYLTDMFGDEAAGFVDRHRAEPWFLYLAFNAPHVPLQATPAYLARVPGLTGKRQTYAAMVTAMDDNIGKVLARLRATGQEERTLIVFLSDNGGPIAQNGSSNLPLRGEKGDSLEGGMHVPFALQWKGTLPAGAKFAPPIIALDLLPTFVAAAGGQTDASWKLDGVNLLPALRGEASLPERTLYWRFNFPPGRPELYRWAVREGDWKVFHHAIRSGEDAGGGGGFTGRSLDALVNLATDLGEKKNLAATAPARAAALEAKWRAWNATLMEPFADQPAPSAKSKKK